MKAHTLFTLSLLFILSLSLFCEIRGFATDSNADLDIAVVANQFDKYAQQDNYIFDGVKFFMKYVNDHGGFQYGNWTREVNIKTRDASVINPALQNSAVVEAYNEMINDSVIVLSPISTPRTTAALSVSEPSKIINLVVGASADSLFKSNKYIFSTVVVTSHIPQYTLSQFIGKASTYILFSTTDAVSVSVTASVTDYMNKSGIVLLHSAQLVINATQNAGLEGQVKFAFQTHFANISADLFVCTFPPDDFSATASAFESVKPDVKAAAFVLPLTRSVQQANAQGTTGDYWVGATQFDSTTDFGISGNFGGTSQEFEDAFVNYFSYAPDPYAATAAAALMSYYVAVKQAGTVNSDAVKQEMLNMPIFNSFLGDIKYFSNGTSEYAKYLTFQFIGGAGEFVNSTAPMIYPAPWPWIPTATNTNTTLPIVGHSTALSIALGVITGICIFIALVALIILVTRSDLFKKQGVIYCGLIVIGVLCAYAAALTTLPTPTDSLCLAFPWLLGMGFTLVFGCLFLKTWVLFQIFRSSLQKLKSLTLTPWYIARLIFSAVLLEAVSLVNIIIDPPKAELQETVSNDRQLMCSRTHPAFWAVFIAYKGIWLVAGVVVSYLTRNIRADYNESKNIVLSIYNCSIIAVVAVLLAYILPTIPSAIVLIQVVAILIIFTFTLVVLFATPWTSLINPPHARDIHSGSTVNMDSYYSRGTASKTSSATSVSGKSKDSKESKESKTSDSSLSVSVVREEKDSEQV